MALVLALLSTLGILLLKVKLSLSLSPPLPLFIFPLPLFPSRISYLPTSIPPVVPVVDGYLINAAVQRARHLGGRHDTEVCVKKAPFGLI
jgi:hypothetical protein